jgi:hypothetical protein
MLMGHVGGSFMTSTTSDKRWTELYEATLAEIQRESRSPPGSMYDRDDRDTAKMIATLRLRNEERRADAQSTPTNTTPPKPPAGVPTWQELIEQESKYREKLTKVQAKSGRMPTHAECLDAMKEVLAEERAQDHLQQKSENFTVLSTGHIDGGTYRVVELPDGSARVEEWRDGAWVPGGATFGEIADAPPVGAGFASKLGIPISDLG